MHRKLTALVIGISNYPDGAHLKNPVNDAEDMSTSLEKLGFSVIKVVDASLEQVDRAVESFRDNLNSNDVGLFYFAGHGMQVKGENYLNTIDSNFYDEISAKHTSFPLNQVIDVMDSCSNKTNIIVLDACRNNPFVRAWNRGPDQSDLATVYTPRGTLIAFATSPGQLAKDGTGRNGSYTEALLKHLDTQDVPIEELFKRVRNTLSTITFGKQTSWEHTSLAGDFYFNISIGRSVDIYSQDAISDSKFLLKPKDPIKDIIAGLRSYNWYTQNPALVELNDKDVSNADHNVLFVFGRNVYQAACGSANSAIQFISNFREIAQGFLSEKTKAILDGMLFEVFFNAKGEIRKDFKLSKFNELFALKQFPEFAPSFEFISEVLIIYQNRFYVIPGKSRNVAVDVAATQNSEGEYPISEINFEGFNILKKYDDGTLGVNDRGGYPIKFSKLLQLISTEMVVPAHQLIVTTSFETEGAKILFPYDKAVRK
jgi:hypothetical protein